MSKPFEITYSPASWNAPPGGQPNVWTVPYGGLHVQAPENLIDPRFTPAMSNFMLRNAELRSRPAFRQFLPGPDGNNIVLGLGSFLSPNNVWHTFSMTPRGLFQLVPNSLQVAASGQNPWVFLGGPSLNTAPLAWSANAGILYYTNGNHLSAWDGSAATPIADVAFLGASPTTVFGSVFLAELDNHLLMLNVTESLASGGVTGVFPNRIRWSSTDFNPTLAGVFGANLGTAGATFDPSINLSAGVNDFIDVPDLITGIMTLGRTGFIFRQNGITEVSPTGVGVAPFDFNHLWASQHGIGNTYPFTIAQYGNQGAFVSAENIYLMTTQGVTAIGLPARDAIIADLANATGSPKASIDRGFNLGYIYVVYHLRIPQATGTRSYVFSLEDSNWASWFSSGVWPTGIANECWV